MNLQTHEFILARRCRFWLLESETETPVAAVLALHGYGSNPETMLRLTKPTVDASVAVASLEGPNQHYTGDGPTSGIPGYNWGIRQHHAEAVILHHEMALEALRQIQVRFSLPATRCFLSAFSQAVGLNYRFVGTYPDAVGGVIAICGGVPKDWEEPKYRDFDTPILHISRSEDEFFPEAVVAGFPARLRTHAKDVEFHLLPGGHRYPSNARDYVRPWMNRVIGAG
jgi:predicted esterase